LYLREGGIVAAVGVGVVGGGAVVVLLLSDSINRVISSMAEEAAGCVVGAAVLPGPTGGYVGG